MRGGERILESADKTVFVDSWPRTLSLDDPKLIEKQEFIKNVIIDWLDKLPMPDGRQLHSHLLVGAVVTGKSSLLTKLQGRRFYLPEGANRAFSKRPMNWQVPAGTDPRDDAMVGLLYYTLSGMERERQIDELLCGNTNENIVRIGGLLHQIIFALASARFEQIPNEILMLVSQKLNFIPKNIYVFCPPEDTREEWIASLDEGQRARRIEALKTASEAHALFKDLTIKGRDFGLNVEEINPADEQDKRRIFKETNPHLDTTQIIKDQMAWLTQNEGDITTDSVEPILQTIRTIPEGCRFVVFSELEKSRAFNKLVTISLIKIINVINKTEKFDLSTPRWILGEGLHIGIAPTEEVIKTCLAHFMYVFENPAPSDISELSILKESIVAFLVEVLGYSSTEQLLTIMPKSHVVFSGSS